MRETGAPCAVSILSSSCLFSIIIAVSIPAFYNADITRINFDDTIQNATGGIDQVRVSNTPFFTNTPLLIFDVTVRKLVWLSVSCARCTVFKQSHTFPGIIVYTGIHSIQTHVSSSHRATFRVNSGCVVLLVSSTDNNDDYYLHAPF